MTVYLYNFFLGIRNIHNWYVITYSKSNKTCCQRTQHIARELRTLGSNSFIYPIIVKAERHTFVFEECGASLSNSKSTTASWPLRAAQCRGVSPSRVFSSMMALFSNSSCTMLLLPQREATWSGVMLF